MDVLGLRMLKTIILTVFSNKNGLSTGAWWIVTKRRDMRCSGLADVENDNFIKRHNARAAFRSPPTGLLALSMHLNLLNSEVRESAHTKRE